MPALEAAAPSQLAVDLIGPYLADAELPGVARSRLERRRLDAHPLEKALYEISYELNNRPDWVRIPLRGVLDLI